MYTAGFTGFRVKGLWFRVGGERETGISRSVYERLAGFSASALGLLGEIRRALFAIVRPWFFGGSLTSKCFLKGRLYVRNV